MANKTPIKAGETPGYIIEQFQAGDTVNPDFLPTQMSVTADASGLKLSGDSATPGNNKLYGTNASGVKGWYAQPGGGGGSSDYLGTGFTSGGGSGTIPDGTVANIPHLTYSTKITANNSYTVTGDNFPFVGFYSSNVDGIRSQFGFYDEDGTPSGIFIAENPGTGEQSLLTVNYAGVNLNTERVDMISRSALNMSTPLAAIYLRDATGVIDIAGTVVRIVPVAQTVRDSVTADAGMMVFNQDVGKMQVYDGSTWQNLW